MQAGRPLHSWESLLCDLAQGGHHTTTPDHTRADQSNGKCRHCQAPAYQSLPVVSELSSKSSDLGFSSKRWKIPGISLNCFSPAKGMRSLSGSGPDSSSNTKCTITREESGEQGKSTWCKCDTVLSRRFSEGRPENSPWIPFPIPNPAHLCWRGAFQPA